MSQYKISSVAAVWLSLFGGMLAQVALAQQSRSDSPQLEEIMVTLGDVRTAGADGASLGDHLDRLLDAQLIEPA